MSQINLTLAQRRAVGELFPELSDRLALHAKHTRQVSLEDDQLDTIRSAVVALRMSTEHGQQRTMLQRVVAALSQAIGDADEFGSIPVAERVYQFKITLLGLDPPIWRRIQVLDGSFDDLHGHIQAAMGWTNSHLYEFDAGGVRIGIPHDDDLIFGGPKTLHAGRMRISHVVQDADEQLAFLYVYDFGDNWEHEILLEGCLRNEKDKEYPVCIDGQYACPPEDVGGIWGYVEFIEAMMDPEHDDHEHYLEWVGEFDPLSFDVKEATQVMREGLPNPF